jgi:hypothetical protein
MTLDACIDGWNNAEKFFVGCGLAGVAFGLFMRSRLTPPQAQTNERAHESRVGGVEIELV